METKERKLTITYEGAPIFLALVDSDGMNEENEYFEYWFGLAETFLEDDFVVSQIIHYPLPLWIAIKTLLLKPEETGPNHSLVLERGNTSVVIGVEIGEFEYEGEEDFIFDEQLFYRAHNESKNKWFFWTYADECHDYLLGHWAYYDHTPEIADYQEKTDNWVITDKNLNIIARHGDAIKVFRTEDNSEGRAETLEDKRYIDLTSKRSYPASNRADDMFAEIK